MSALRSLSHLPTRFPKTHAGSFCFGSGAGSHLCVFLTVDLDRLNDDVKRYSCTPRNYSVNLREELKLTHVVFFPRCLLVQRCGGNCGCGTANWKSCTCSSGKTVKKYHEVCPSQTCMSSFQLEMLGQGAGRPGHGLQLFQLFTAQRQPSGRMTGS